MRKAAALVLALAASSLALINTTASASCVETGPTGGTIVYIGWPVHFILVDPGPVTVNPTDCV
jgi:hypothetical protein